MTEIEFLDRLKKIGDAGLTVLDIRILHYMLANQGQSAKDISLALGMPNRSMMIAPMHRMFNNSYIEDRRVERRRASPARLYVTFSGMEVWELVKP